MPGLCEPCFSQTSLEEEARDANTCKRMAARSPIIRRGEGAAEKRRLL
jgi:hypothetical protein